MSAIHVYILHHFWVPAVYFKLLNQGIWLRWSVYVFLFLFLISLKMTFSSPLAEYFALSLHLSLSSLRLPSSLLYSSSWPEFPSTFLTFLGVTFFLFSPLALFPFHYLFFPYCNEEYFITHATALILCNLQDFQRHEEKSGNSVTCLLFLITFSCVNNVYEK